MPPIDAESLLRAARRPLVIGMGGGGDVVGALATAEHARRYDGADPVLGGVAWERRPIDPQPGPRSAAEITAARPLAPGALLAGPDTRTERGGVRFAESRMADLLGSETVLIDPHPGPAVIASALGTAVTERGCDLTVFVDVGGDVLAHGDEPGLRSPLCDALLLSAAGRMVEAGLPVLLAIFGLGCDAELTPAEVLTRIGQVAARGGLLGVRGLTAPVAARVRQAAEAIPTEASLAAVRAFLGESGAVPIRGGARTVELSPVAAVTWFLDVPESLAACGRLARAVDPARTLDEANEALHALGVRTELDLEREAV
jgi:hypothetical protein